MSVCVSCRGFEQVAVGDDWGCWQSPPSEDHVCGHEQGRADTTTTESCSDTRAVVRVGEQWGREGVAQNLTNGEFEQKK